MVFVLIPRQEDEEEEEEQGNEADVDCISNGVNMLGRDGRKENASIVVIMNALEVNANAAKAQPARETCDEVVMAFK